MDQQDDYVLREKQWYDTHMQINIPCKMLIVCLIVTNTTELQCISMQVYQIILWADDMWMDIISSVMLFYWSALTTNMTWNIMWSPFFAVPVSGNRINCVGRKFIISVHPISFLLTEDNTSSHFRESFQPFLWLWCLLLLHLLYENENSLLARGTFDE